MIPTIFVFKNGEDEKAAYEAEPPRISFSDPYLVSIVSKATDPSNKIDFVFIIY